ncbi:unnamed protein product [Protopolystoma xenopodis]|uniref:Uncharacterized protein n=1 Tax=Protopolystoma xenopodis TaxID=117903 RepID=A0A3S4ZHC6_9PLAT|nr:unnamed protein product [Protopolystoma xenopodis]
MRGLHTIMRLSAPSSRLSPGRIMHTTAIAPSLLPPTPTATETHLRQPPLGRPLPLAGRQNTHKGLAATGSGRLASCRQD